MSCGFLDKSLGYFFRNMLEAIFQPLLQPKYTETLIAAESHKGKNICVWASVTETDCWCWTLEVVFLRNVPEVKNFWGKLKLWTDGWMSKAFGLERIYSLVFIIQPEKDTTIWRQEKIVRRNLNSYQGWVLSIGEMRKKDVSRSSSCGETWEKVLPPLLKVRMAHYGYLPNQSAKDRKSVTSQWKGVIHSSGSLCLEGASTLLWPHPNSIPIETAILKRWRTETFWDFGAMEYRHIYIWFIA